MQSAVASRAFILPRLTASSALIAATTCSAGVLVPVATSILAAQRNRDPDRDHRDLVEKLLPAVDRLGNVNVHVLAPRAKGLGRGSRACNGLGPREEARCHLAHACGPYSQRHGMPVSPSKFRTIPGKAASARTSLARMTTQRRPRSTHAHILPVELLCPPLKKPRPCGPSNTITPRPSGQARDTLGGRCFGLERPKLGSGGDRQLWFEHLRAGVGADPLTAHEPRGEARNVGNSCVHRSRRADLAALVMGLDAAVFLPAVGKVIGEVGPPHHARIRHSEAVEHAALHFLAELEAQTSRANWSNMMPSPE